MYKIWFYQIGFKYKSLAVLQNPLNQIYLPLALYFAIRNLLERTLISLKTPKEKKELFLHIKQCKSVNQEAVNLIDSIIQYLHFSMIRSIRNVSINNIKCWLFHSARIYQPGLCSTLKEKQKKKINEQKLVALLKWTGFVNIDNV